MSDVTKPADRHALDLDVAAAEPENPVSKFFQRNLLWTYHSIPSIEENGIVRRLQAEMKATSVRFSEAYFGKISSELTQQSPDLLTLGSSDCLMFDHGKAWSLSLLKKALIWGAGHFGKVDIRKSALFCGDSRAVGAIMSVFVHVGYSNIYWYSGEEDRDESALDAFKRNHFGAKIHQIDTEGFRMLGPICSMAVLKSRAAPSRVLVEEMDYFNYLSPGGVLFDANWEILSETFDQQVIGQDFHFIPSKTVRQWVDQTWVEVLNSRKD